MIPKRSERAAARPTEHYGGRMEPERTVRVSRGQDSLTVSVWDGPGPVPVVLLHGLSQQRHFWGPVVRHLAQRPVAALDQRGHGDSDWPLTAEYGIPACADDVVAVLDALGWDRAVVVGHSWGASVALAVAAAHPGRVAGAALLDGGLWSPSALGPRAEVRERLTPPALGLPPDDLWALIRAGDLGPAWSDEVQAALAPTFREDPDRGMVTRIGVDRHLRVLDGLLDYDPSRDLAQASANGTPVWAVACESRGADAPWSSVRAAGVALAATVPGVLVQRWGGAIHDVPLQWPALVAGLVDALAESVAPRRRGEVP